MGSEGLASDLAHIRQKIASATPTLGPSDFPTLATVDADGLPAVRSVVLRHYDPSIDLMHVTTRADSAKVDQLRGKPAGELLIWFPQDRLQLRLRCTWQIVVDPASDERNAAWSALSAATQATFYWPELFSGQTIFPPPAFALLVGLIQRIDALVIAKPIHQRYLHEKRNGAWDRKAIPA